MSLVRDLNSDVIHRQKKREGGTLITYCGERIPANRVRPAGTSSYRCSKCREFYKTNLGKLPQDENGENNQ